MGISFRLMKPFRLFSGLEVVKGAAVRVDAAGLWELLDNLIGARAQKRRHRSAGLAPLSIFAA